MKAKTFRHKILSLVFISMLSLIACNDGDTNQKEPEKIADEKNDAKFSGSGEKDAEALTDAFSSSMFEKELSDSIKLVSPNKEVKLLADNMAQAHNKLNEQMKELAAKKSISLPSMLSTDQHEKISKMVDKKPSDQGEDYVNELIDSHKNSISKYERSAESCTDPEIKAWFVNTLPALRQNLDMATMYKDKMEKK